MTSLNDVKLMLGISENDLDDKLSLIVELATARLSVLLGGDVPDELEYIILEVCVNRFNRLGSEGLTGHSVEGESLQFIADDFSPYADEITAYRKRFEGAGRLRFL